MPRSSEVGIPEFTDARLIAEQAQRYGESGSRMRTLGRAYLDLIAERDRLIEALERIWTYDMTSPGPPIIRMQEIARAALAAQEPK